MLHLRSRGFALIELMVVVAILSMVASFMVPRFLKHRIQQKQKECQLNLQSLYREEKAYYEKNHVFTQDFSQLGWIPQGKGLYGYRFLPVNPEHLGFLFECSGNIDKDPTLDRATIDDTGQVTQTSDDTQN